MRNANENHLINHVIWHCQFVYDLDSARAAVEYARRDGFLDTHNRLTSIGRSVAKMMVQDFNHYKDLVSIKIGEQQDFNNPQASY
tara:strand:- start:245 stop:499 length:255 start_codon:yes stop_codon:yes gene_type:complete